MSPQDRSIFSFKEKVKSLLLITLYLLLLLFNSNLFSVGWPTNRAINIFHRKEFLSRIEGLRRS